MNYDMKVSVHKAHGSSKQQFIDELLDFADDFTEQECRWLFEHNDELAFLYFGTADCDVHFKHMVHIESIQIERGQYAKHCKCGNPQCNDV